MLAICTAVGGGIVRDVLIGATPPAALRDWRYLVTALAAVLLIWVLHATLDTYASSPVLITLDAGGLSLFAVAVAGAEKALDAGLSPLLAIPLGAITGVGGGTVRDLLLNRVPQILHGQIYATAALFGAAVMVLARRLQVPPVAAAGLGAAACFALRLASVWRGWSLPDM
ncbi:MAG: trimeric intracellular cation channel family protein [Candidatus Dormibacteraceae bacterium]